MFSFNTSSTANTTTASKSLSFNFNSAPKTTTTSAPATGLTGLSGLTSTTVKTTTSAAPPLSIPSKPVSAQDTKVDIKEDPVPPEIVKDVNTFKEYIKKQKEESNEIARFNTKPLHKITSEVKSLQAALSTVSSSYKRNISTVKRLQTQFCAELNHAENAHITQNIVEPTMQLDNVLPVKYFQEVVQQFEVDMALYQTQITELEQHLHAINNPAQLNAQDISTALVKMHDGFITLASNLHLVHSRVNQLKDQFLIYRRLVYGDTTDIFDKSEKAGAEMKSASSTRNNNLSNAVALAMASIMQQSQPVNPSSAQPAAPAAFGTASSGGLFGAKTTTNTAAASGGLFGSKPAAATGGLFGAKTTTASSTGGLFGSTGATSGGLFGSKPTAAGTKSLFGTTAATTTASSGFGSSSAAGTLFGGSNTLFNFNKTSAQPSQQQQQQQRGSNLLRATLSTGFS